MGLLPKSKIEEIKKAQRQAKLAKKRRVATRNVSVSFLIVCEGKRTEPAYFEALVKNRYSEVRKVSIKGAGCGTVSLIRQAIHIRDHSDKEFDRVWVVFDKDDFTDFNDAIRLAGKEGIECAWSNESFELWYCLHFHYLDTGISREQYIEALEREIRRCTGNPDYRYMKKSPETFALLQGTGDENMAIRHACRLRDKFVGDDYASHKPCTTVDLLVGELTHPENLL